MRKDTSPRVPQREKIKETLSIRESHQLTEKQQTIINCCLNKDTKCVFIDGVWGSSKTWLTVLASLKLLSDKKIDQILYIRNPVESSTTGKLGYLKGDISEKMGPYNAPLYEKLDEFLASSAIKKLEEDKRIECLPLGLIRGRSFNCKAIIVDEAASMSQDDLHLILTRCGRFTKIFFIGDSENQNDIGSKSGFKKVIDTLNDQECRDNGIYVFEMKSESDILRSDFVRFIMKKLGKIKV